VPLLPIGVSSLHMLTEIDKRGVVAATSRLGPAMAMFNSLAASIVAKIASRIDRTRCFDWTIKRK
jgi:hypothetical protein